MPLGKRQAISYLTNRTISSDKRDDVDRRILATRVASVDVGVAETIHDKLVSPLGT